MFKYLHIIKQYYSVKYLVQQINLTNQSKKAKVSCSFNATMFGNSIPGPRSNNKVAISMQMHPKVINSRVQIGNQQHPVLCLCQLVGQDIPKDSFSLLMN